MSGGLEYQTVQHLQEDRRSDLQFLGRQEKGVLCRFSAMHSQWYWQQAVHRTEEPR